MLHDKHDSTQRQALLKWVEGVVKKHVPDTPKAELMIKNQKINYKEKNKWQAIII